MLRLLWSAAAALTLFALTGVCAVEAQEKKTDETKADKGKKWDACIVKVDKKKHTVTVKIKDKEGKEHEKTFTLAEEVRMLDSTGRVAAMEVFQSGNDVLIVEAEGKITQMQKKDKSKSTPEKSGK